MQLIDSHVHLNFDVFEPDLPAVRSRWQEAGVVRLVHSCVEPAEFASIQLLATKIPELSFAVGLHPLDADKWVANTAEQIVSFARSDNKVVAIGEIGLDFYKAENQIQQKNVFVAQLEIARELDLPVIIHCRDAANIMRDVIHDFQQQHGQVKGVMHCWTGNAEETEWFLDLGFYVSFSGIVTFKNAKQIQESAKMVWKDRLLIETDCPFLSPVPKRSQKRNEPAFVRYVAETLATLRDVTTEDIAALTTTNACKLFGLSV
ncbi:TatD family hydrolase [Gloeocapsopsis crepidinum LEGE 06123]|uniref:D-aminoacyl-tRNA deacylase n=1 Tax=Gloeocapsopsis crepidinum LEGE 06123 TaxID=588587 RepID=A0ABR9UUK9_9CHRO|nr:TatD family hydrolase [Gloeocapsopsis crepidinum]MBE9191988.1 TatD family hydrolase [Gloeocapsopsis crepidinum LEGE 06123]